jgi:hypothetical protein
MIHGGKIMTMLVHFELRLAGTHRNMNTGDQNAIDLFDSVLGDATMKRKIFFRGKRKSAW